MAAFIRATAVGFDPDVLTRDRCGWWWCRAQPAKVPWPDLSAALRRLRTAGIDPTSMDVAQLAYQFTGIENAAAEREEYLKLEQALKAVDVGLHAETLRSEYLAEVQGFLQNTPAKSEADGRPIVPHHRAAVATAQGLGWAAEDVAAIMLITGVERLNRGEDFGDLKDRWRKRWKRGDLPRGRN
jgi:hypothetical protein